MKRRIVRALIILGVLVTVYVPVTLLTNFTGGAIEITPEITCVVEPLRADGTVDYLRAVNLRYAEGISLDNNAAPLLWQIVPDLVKPPVRSETAKILGVSVPSLSGPCLVSPEEHFARVPVAQWPTPPEPFEGLSWSEIRKRRGQIQEKLARRVEAYRRARPERDSDANAERFVRALKRLVLTQEERALLDLPEPAELVDRRLWETTDGPWAGEQYPAVEAWLKANDKPLAMLSRVVQRPRFYLPVVCADPSGRLFLASVPSYRRTRQLAEALIARSMRRLHAGQLDLAWADVMVTYRLARLLGQDSRLIGQLVGIVADGMASQAGRTLAAQGRPTAKQAEQFLAELAHLPPLPDVTETICFYERLVVLDPVFLLAGSGGRSSEAQVHVPRLGVLGSPIDWNAVMRTLNERLDLRDRACRRAGVEEAELAKARDRAKEMYQGLQQCVEDMARWQTILWMGVPLAGRRVLTAAMADVLSALAIVSYESTTDQAYYAPRVGRALCRGALAVAVFRAKTGRMPKALKELVPEQIGDLPLDPYTGQPLGYRRDRQGWLLYSVGANRVHDGAPEGAGDAGDDIVVRFPN